jgi:hypothetical protein
MSLWTFLTGNSSEAESAKLGREYGHEWAAQGGNEPSTSTYYSLIEESGATDDYAFVHNFTEGREDYKDEHRGFWAWLTNS